MKKKKLLINYLVVFVMFLITTSCSSSQANKGDGNVLLSIQLKNAENQKALLQHLLSTDVEFVDSLLFDANGKCEISFNIEEIGFYSVSFPEIKKDIRLLLEGGDKAKIKGDLNDLLGTLELSGSDNLNQLNEFHDIVFDYKTFSDSLRAAYAEYQSKNMHFLVDEEFNQIYETRSIAMENKVIDFINTHEGNFITLMAIRSLNPRNTKNLEQFVKVDEVMIKKYPQSNYVQYLNQEISRLTALRVGGIAPNFILPSYEGPDIQLNDFKGQYVLIDFWATWCKPCIAEIPYLAQAKEQFASKGLEVISVCIDRVESKAAWNKIIQNHGNTWVHLFDGIGETAEMYDIKAFPTLVLLDKEGKVLVTSKDNTANFRREGMLTKLQEIIQ